MGSPYQDGQLYRPRYLQDRYSDEWRFQHGHAAGLRGGRGVRQHLSIIKIPTTTAIFRDLLSNNYVTLRSASLAFLGRTIKTDLNNKRFVFDVYNSIQTVP